jgi:hypothetical protein
VPAHHVPNLANHPVAVGGDHLHDHSHTAGTVALEIHLFVLFAFELPGAALQRPLDVVIRHVLVFGGQNRGAQPGIGVRVPAADPGGNRDFADQLGKDPSSLGVSSRLLVLDGCPFRVP